MATVAARGSRELKRLGRPRRQIVALGGGGFSMEPKNPLMDDYLFSLAQERAEARGDRRPRICFLPTASGDADHYVVRFYQHFGTRADCSHISLFRRDKGAPGKPTDHLRTQDLIYVGGGSVISLLGVWRAHGIDDALAEAWRSGVILAGLSAGSLCWFSEGVTAFHGDASRIRGLGLLPCSNCVHFDGEPGRDIAYREMLMDGMPAGYAVEDGAALHFVGSRLVHVISSRPKARAFRMRKAGGRIVRSALSSRYLGDVGSQTAALVAVA